MSTAHQVDGNTLTLLRNGEEYFPRLIAAIDGATRFIHLETYIYAADSTGKSVSQALQRAAKRGLVVRLLLDGFGSGGLPDPWVMEMRASGVQVLWFRPEISLFRLRRYRLRRLHRKLAVIDGIIAFVSGMNINDDVPGGMITSPRLDYAIEVQGESVNHIHAVMRRLWVQVSWVNFRRQPKYDRHRDRLTDLAQGKVTFLIRDNLRHRRDIEQAYLRAIAGAQQEIIIANAYFLPGLRMRQALLAAAQRGIRVLLLLQGKVEYRLQHYATHAFYSELLGAGVEIYEYRTSLMHAKVAVVDSYWATVGSSNIDPFSLWLAREANLVVSDSGFAQALRASLLQDILHDSVQVTHRDWRKKSIAMRLLVQLSYTIVRFLTGMIGNAPVKEDT